MQNENRSSEYPARFSDGERATPLAPMSDEGRPIGAIGTLLLFLLLVLSFLLTTILTSPAHADEPGPLPNTIDPVDEIADVIYSHANEKRQLECVIDSALRVRGKKRTACVEKLATAARLARGEMIVNVQRVRR